MTNGELHGRLDAVLETVQLKREFGSKEATDFAAALETWLERAVAQAATLDEDAGLRAAEPDDLAAIRALRPDAPRRLWRQIPPEYADKLAGALLARVAGCTLGTLVENWSIERMEALAAWDGEPFPPEDYPATAPEPWAPRYGLPQQRNTRAGMDGAPPDDDTVYTLLGLLIAEEYGPAFTTGQVGEAWAKYLPYACTAEEAALNNLRTGVPAARAAEVNNPWVQWIGAAIRSDPWAYMAPGWPEKAAELAWRDAVLSHRRNGVYGEMFWAAAQSAAFAASNARQALEAGLGEIPAECTLAKALRWALGAAPGLADWRAARAAVDERFPGMHRVHTINNACLTVFGLLLGGGDVNRTLSITVAMGLDNDCTAATAGSIAGALAGSAALAPHWTAPFGGRILSYLNGHPEFGIEDVLARFGRQARRFFAAG